MKTAFNLDIAPQPSEDPNDPLNWPRSSKLVCFFVIIFGCVMNAAVISSLLNPGLVQIAKDCELNIKISFQILAFGGFQIRRDFQETLLTPMVSQWMSLLAKSLSYPDINT